MNILTIINIISASPILLYPLFLGTSIMVFDAPGSGKSFWSVATALIVVGFPLFIGLFIFLSRKYSSNWLALVACIPLIFLIYTLFVQNFLDNRHHEKIVNAVISTISQDFIYDSSIANTLAKTRKGTFFYEKGTFLSIDKEYNQVIQVNPNASGSFFSEPVGKIKGDILEINSFDLKTAQDAYAVFVNKEGKTIFDVFKVVIAQNSPNNFNLDKYQVK